MLENHGLREAARRLYGRSAHAAELVARSAQLAIAKGETTRASDILAFGIEASPESTLLWRLAVALEWDSDRAASTRWMCHSAIKAIGGRCAALWRDVIAFEWQSGSSAKTVTKHVEDFVKWGVRLDLDWLWGGCDPNQAE